MSDANRVQLACRKEATFGVEGERLCSVPIDPGDDNAGNGDVSLPVAVTTAPKETWTLTCTATITIFSVSGSKSGTITGKETATAGEIYDNGIVSFKITAGATPFEDGDNFTFDVEADFQIVRHTGESLKQDTTVITSEEIRSDRQIADIIRTGVGASGGVDFELSYGTFDDFLQAVLFSAGWSTEVLLPAAPSLLSDPGDANTGDGVLTTILADNAAPVETWTITCTSTVGPPAFFSVVGSVSGAQDEAEAEVAYDNGFIAFIIEAGVAAFIEGDNFEFGVTRGKTISVSADDNAFNELLTPVLIVSTGVGVPTDITGIAAPGTTPPTVASSETWTMICTTPGGDGIGKFSVEGSIHTIPIPAEATVGTEYDNGHIKFTIAEPVEEGDWEIDEEFVITNNFSGLAANRWIRVAGFPTASAANNGWFKIVSKTSLQVVVTHGTLVDVGVNTNITMQMGAEIINGQTLASWNLEREYKDLTAIFSLFTGMCISEMGLDIPADGRITGSFTFLGSKEVSGAASVGTGNIAATTENIMTGANHVDDVFENKLEAGILSFAMSINNNLRTRLQVGTLGAVSIGSGSILITGSLELYLPDEKLFDKYLNQDATSLAIGVTDGAGNGYIIEIPTMRITDGSRPAGGLNTDVVGTFEWQAYMDPTEGISVRITRFPVL